MAKNKPESPKKIEGPKAMPSTGYWLMKSEPDVFSIQDLKKNKTTLWEGVRNYQARNYMVGMQVGEQIFFYHSSCETPGIYGSARVSKTSVADPTQFDKKSEYYEAKATPEKPIWFCVEIQFENEWAQPISLEQIKKDKNLSEMLVVKKGQRLSIQPVSKKDFSYLVKLGK
jgi:predicted RNA-binding protein with PUA-like domain